MEHLAWGDERLWPQFEALVAVDPTALALVDCDERLWTRQELHEIATNLAGRLRGLGIGRGDRALMTCHKTAVLCAAALAVSAIGAIFCPLSADLDQRSVSWLEERVGHAAKIIASADGQISIEVREPGLRSKDHRDSGAVLIAFTSGTTGVPKGVMHGPTALNYVTRACAAIVGLQAAEPILGIIPLDSVAGYTFTVHFSLSLGHPLVLLKKWNPLRAMDLLARYGCAWTTMVPTQLFLMVEAGRRGEWRGALPMRAISVGGSPITPELIADAKAILGIRALRMFGMSECLAHCSATLDDPPERQLSFDGRPFPQTQIEVFSEDCELLPRLQRGEAGVRGPALFLGYCAGMGAGQERSTAEGFYLTGDEMVRDEEGYVRIVGRRKDQIIRGGFNIDPAEVEAALLRHPAVAEAAVVAVPDRKLGEQACAVCRLRPGYAGIDLSVLLEHLGAVGLLKKKWPEHLVVVDSMRLLPIGKIDKRAMAVQATAELDRRRGVTGKT